MVKALRYQLGGTVAKVENAPWRAFRARGETGHGCFSAASAGGHEDRSVLSGSLEQVARDILTFCQ
jgi:hypothetical protein